MVDFSERIRFLPIGVNQFQKVLKGKAEVIDGFYTEGKPHGRNVIDTSDKFILIKNGKKKEMSLADATKLFLDNFNPANDGERFWETALKVQFDMVAIHSCTYSGIKLKLSQLKTLLRFNPDPIHIREARSSIDFCGISVSDTDDYKTMVASRVRKIQRELGTEWISYREYNENLERVRNNKSLGTALFDLHYSLGARSSILRGPSGGPDLLSSRNYDEIKNAEKQLKILAANAPKIEDDKRFNKQLGNLAHLNLADMALKHHEDWGLAASHLASVVPDATYDASLLGSLFKNLLKANELKGQTEAIKHLEEAVKYYKDLKKRFDNLDANKPMNEFYSVVVESILKQLPYAFAITAKYIGIRAKDSKTPIIKDHFYQLFNEIPRCTPFKNLIPGDTNLCG